MKARSKRSSSVSMGAISFLRMGNEKGDWLEGALSDHSATRVYTCEPNATWVVWISVRIE